MKRVNYAALPTNIKCALSDYNSLSNLAEQCMDAMLSLFPDQEAPVRALMEAYGEWHHNSQRTKEELLAFGLNKDDLDELLLADYVARNAKHES